eukprot:17513_1
MKRKLEEDNKDITSTSNPQKKQKLGTNEAIIQQVNNIYSLHITWEMLYPHTRGSHPYHLMHFRIPHPYTIIFDQFKLKQIEQFENYYNTPNESQSTVSLTIGEFEGKTIDKKKKQITNDYGESFLNRTQKIILNDANQMKIINDLVYEMKQLNIVWNSEEFRRKDGYTATELLPIVLFDINKQIETEQLVKKSLTDSDFGTNIDTNVLKLIT